MQSESVREDNCLRTNVMDVGGGLSKDYVGSRRKRTVTSGSSGTSSAVKRVFGRVLFFPLAVDFVVFCFAGSCCGPSLGDQVCFEGGGVRNALLSRPFLIVLFW